MASQTAVSICITTPCIAVISTRMVFVHRTQQKCSSNMLYSLQRQCSTKLRHAGRMMTRSRGDSPVRLSIFWLLNDLANSLTSQYGL